MDEEEEDDDDEGEEEEEQRQDPEAGPTAAARPMEDLEENGSAEQVSTGCAEHSSGKRKYKPRKCPGCDRVIGFNYKKQDCPKCHTVLPEYVSRRRGRREGRIEKWTKQGKHFKAADFHPLKNEARKTAAKAAGSKAIVGCFMVYLDSSGAVSSESFITEPGLEQSMKQSMDSLEKRSESLFNNGGLELWSLYHDLKKRKLSMQQLDKIKQLTANIGSASDATRVQPNGAIHAPTQYHGQMIGEAVAEPGQQPDLRHKYPPWP